MRGQKERELKFLGTQEVPVLRSVLVFSLHHPLLVSERRNMYTTAVVDGRH